MYATFVPETTGVCCSTGQSQEANTQDLSFASAVDAQRVQQELQVAAEASSACQEQQSSMAEAGSSSAPRWQEGLCGMSLLPLNTLQLPLATLQSGKPCLVSLCRSRAVRVSYFCQEIVEVSS